MLDARRKVEDIQDELRRQIGTFLTGDGERASETFDL